MHKLSFRKADGRNILLYSDEVITPPAYFPSPRGVEIIGSPHQRWHPLLSEWVVFASHRQNRTFLPPKEYNPLRPSAEDAEPTELPQGNYKIAVFENLFPSFKMSSAASDIPQDLYIPSRPAEGICEVVVFSQEADTSLGRMPLAEINLLFEVWADRTRELSALSQIKYIMPFENRGVEVGVTLHHPHGQIYAYTHLPSLPARRLEQQRLFFEKNSQTLISSIIEAELKDGRRILYESAEVVAFVPAFARYPYEVWICPKRAVPYVSDLQSAERLEISRALKTILLKYDGLWQRTFPYLMILHQAATHAENPQFAHFHIEFSPPYRSQNRLKFLAGTELGAGVFVNDSLPEEKAQELREVELEEKF